MPVFIFGANLRTSMFRLMCIFIIYLPGLLLSNQMELQTGTGIHIKTEEYRLDTLDSTPYCGRRQWGSRRTTTKRALYRQELFCGIGDEKWRGMAERIILGEPTRFSPGRSWGRYELKRSKDCFKLTRRASESLPAKLSLGKARNTYGKCLQILWGPNQIYQPDWSPPSSFIH